MMLRFIKSLAGVKASSLTHYFYGARQHQIISGGRRQATEVNLSLSRDERYLSREVLVFLLIAFVVSGIRHREVRIGL